MDLATAQAHLQYWLDQDQASATSAAYNMGNRSKTNHDPETIRQQIQYWEGRVWVLQNQATGNRNPRAVFVSWGC